MKRLYRIGATLVLSLVLCLGAIPFGRCYALGAPPVQPQQFSIDSGSSIIQGKARTQDSGQKKPTIAVPADDDEERKCISEEAPSLLDNATALVGIIAILAGIALVYVGAYIVWEKFKLACFRKKYNLNSDVTERE